MSAGEAFTPTQTGFLPMERSFERFTHEQCQCLCTTHQANSEDTLEELPQVGIQAYGYEQHPDLSGKPRAGVFPLTRRQESSRAAREHLCSPKHSPMLPRQSRILNPLCMQAASSTKSQLGCHFSLQTPPSTWVSASGCFMFLVSHSSTCSS